MSWSRSWSINRRSMGESLASLTLTQEQDGFTYLSIVMRLTFSAAFGELLFIFLTCARAGARVGRRSFFDIRGRTLSSFEPLRPPPPAAAGTLRRPLRG